MPRLAGTRSATACRGSSPACHSRCRCLQAIALAQGFNTRDQLPHTGRCMKRLGMGSRCCASPSLAQLRRGSHGCIAVAPGWNPPACGCWKLLCGCVAFSWGRDNTYRNTLRRAETPPCGTWAPRWGPCAPRRLSTQAPRWCCVVVARSTNTPQRRVDCTHSGWPRSSQPVGHAEDHSLAT